MSNADQEDVKLLTMLEGRSDYVYTNKMLVLVGKSHYDRYVFAYSYDDRELGIYEMEELG